MNPVRLNDEEISVKCHQNLIKFVCYLLCLLWVLFIRFVCGIKKFVKMKAKVFWMANFSRVASDGFPRIY